MKKLLVLILCICFSACAIPLNTNMVPVTGKPKATQKTISSIKKPKDDMAKYWWAMMLAGTALVGLGVVGAAFGPGDEDSKMVTGLNFMMGGTMFIIGIMAADEHYK